MFSDFYYFANCMNKKEQIEYWIDTADHDLETAQTLYETGHYDWCLFIGHLVLEKALKAHWVNDNEEVPPKIHDLVRLANGLEVSVDDREKILYDTVNAFNYDIEYPELKVDLDKKYTKELANRYLPKIKEKYNHLKTKLNY